MIEAER